MSLRLRSLLSADDGNVAVVFALASLPILGFAGMAVDYGLASRLDTQLQAATDATSLALCQTPSATTLSQLQLQASTMMQGYMGSDVGLTVDALTMTSAPRKITLTARATSQAFLGGFTGTKRLPVAATAQCATPLPKTFEIALVLDTTGSMAASGGAQTKIQALQQAAANFVDYVHDNSAFSTDTRISIVPFAASVAVDPAAYRTANWVDTAGRSSYHWANVDKASANAAGFTSRFSIFDALKTTYSGWGWAGCFETLPYPQNTQEGVPTTNDTLFVPMFAPDEPGGGSNTYTVWNNTYVSFNSYIDDFTGVGACTGGSTFQTLENAACKYVGAKTAKPTNNNPYTGIPNGPNFQCVSQPLQRLTSNTGTLKALINSLSAAGSTNIHEGLMWGWRTLSPVSVFADGAAYSTAPTATNKIIVLMTDGANTWPDNPYPNYNQTMYFSHGYLTNADGSGPNSRLPPGNQNISTTAQERNALDALTQTGCTNAKTAGVSIYTVGFSVASDPIDAQGINLLKNCASSAGQAYIANYSTDLIKAFDLIAKSIGALRLTQ